MPPSHRLRLTVTAAATLLLAAIPCRAGWGQGGCAPVGVPVSVPEWQWVNGPTDPDQVHLLHYGRQVGTWRHSDQHYFPYDGRAWGEAANPPATAPGPPSPEPTRPRSADCARCRACPCAENCCCADGRACCDPCRCLLPAPEHGPLPEENYGLDRSKISRRERCTVNGREISKEAAFGLVGDREPSLPNDVDKPWLIDVGDKAAGKRIDADLAAAPELAPYRSVFRRQSYRPDDVMVRDREGKVMYPAGVYAVNAAGKPRRLLAAYTTAGDLAGALRKLPPDFDPKNIPPVDPPPPAPAPTPADDPAPWAVGGTLAATIVAIGYLLTRKS
jgi:hypothetical protein